MNSSVGVATLVFVDGSDNGGFWLDQDGNLHIIRPWNDDEGLAKCVRQLRAANSLLQLAHTSGDSDLSRMAGNSGVNLLRAAQQSLDGSLVEQEDGITQEGSALIANLSNMPCMSR